MNYAMIKILVLKDWSFNRIAIGAYLVGGLISLMIMRYGGELGFHLGNVFLLTILLGMGIHMTVTTVVHERKEKTLPFVMSLPISVKEYTTAKLLANLLLFTLPWVTVLVACIFFIMDSSYFANGLIPFVVITMVGIFLGYVLLVGMSLVFESMAWTIAGIIGCNLLLQVSIHLIPRIQAIRVNMTAAEPVWNFAAVGLILTEIVITVMLLALTYYFQARKKDFT